MKALQVNNTEIFNDFVELYVLNNAANHELDCLDGLIITFEVTITDDDEDSFKDKDFTIQFQSAERNNGMIAYNGYEMMCDGDVDESQELIEFMDYDESFIDQLYEQAKERSKAVLNSML
ncbi:hypothetical protein [Pseudoalteromonas sp. 5-MNA-CIBAN-0065]|uniref:hypothetical protein n=1 Tax=Pseudoalteromonas sp. 5-MNA-CIBAN-0065 TaxID=3140421 RepID=UPI00332B78C6